MLTLRECPRCSGCVAVETDFYGQREFCRQCGWCRDLNVPPPEPMKLDEKRTRNGGDGAHVTFGHRVTERQRVAMLLSEILDGGRATPAEVAAQLSMVPIKHFNPLPGEGTYVVTTDKVKRWADQILGIPTWYYLPIRDIAAKLGLE